eukprot:1881961-Prymnesium_polylepis.1
MELFGEVWSDAGKSGRRGVRRLRRLWASEAASKPLALHGAAAPRQSGWRPLPCSWEMTRACRDLYATSLLHRFT